MKILKREKKKKGYISIYIVEVWKLSNIYIGPIVDIGFCGPKCSLGLVEVVN